MTNDFRVTVSGKVKTIFNLSIFLGICPIRGFPIPQSSRGTNDFLQATKEMLKLSFISNISFFDPKTFKDKSDFFFGGLSCVLGKETMATSCAAL